jgi:selenide,water dikinase
VSCRGLLGDDAVVRVVSDDIAVVENVDIFTPIIDDPFTQGEIVACNATNDVFAMGVHRIISLQAFLAYPSEMSDDIAVGVLKGMSHFMKDLDSNVTGGQTITNPCPVFGGICTGVAHPDDVIYSCGARPGDSVILTKPLGIQPAMRSYRDLKDEKRDALLERFTEQELEEMQDVAIRIMTQSNLEVAKAMQQVGAHAATDITGFGLLGHAENVAALSGVDIIFESLPVIRGILPLAAYFGHKVSTGLGAETAGGMLVFLDPEKEEAFSSLLRDSGLPCWSVGHASKPMNAPSSRLAEDVQFIETEFP